MRLTILDTLSRVTLPVAAAALLLSSPAMLSAIDAPGPAAPASRPAKPAGPSTRAVEPDLVLAPQVSRPLNGLKLDGVAVSDALDFFRDVTGINLAVDWAGLEASGVPRTTPVTVSARDGKAADVLTRVLAAADKASREKGHRPTAWDAIGGVVIIAPPGHMHRAFVPAPALAAKARDEKSKTALALVLPEVKFDGVAFGDALDFIRDATGMTVEVDWAKLAGAGLPKDTRVSLLLKNIPAGRVLNLVLFAAGGKSAVDFSAQDGQVTIFLVEPTKGLGRKDAKKP